MSADAGQLGDVMGWAQHNLTAETRDRIARTLFVVQQEDGDWLNTTTARCPLATT